MATVGVRLKGFRRRQRLFSLAVVSRPGKNHPPLCPLCLCIESSIRPPQAVIMRSRVTIRIKGFSFFNREAYIWGAYYAMAKFNHNNGKIEADDGTVIGDWVPGVWYQVKVVLDRSTNTYSVWIDGELRGEGLSTTRSDTHLINALALVSAHAGVKVYYDDARVFEITNDPPVADAGPDQTVIVGETCTFDGSGSYDPDGTIVSWEWDFDDGTTGSGETATHEYSSPGVYTATLTVTDDDGATDTDTATVIVQTPAEATEDLVSEVEALDLPHGTENSLVSKLQAAIDSLDRGQENAAANQLSAFINQVEAQRGKKISDAEADALIAAAQAIIDALMDE